MHLPRCLCYYTFLIIKGFTPRTEDVLTLNLSTIPFLTFSLRFLFLVPLSIFSCFESSSGFFNVVFTIKFLEANFSKMFYSRLHHEFNQCDLGISIFYIQKSFKIEQGLTMFIELLKVSVGYKELFNFVLCLVIS